MMTQRATIVLVLAFLSLTACKRDNDNSQAKAGEVSRSWSPTGIRTVKGVPVAAFREQVALQLKAKPAQLSDDHWEHVKHVYSAYNNSPLWMDEDGLMKERASALIDALVNATTDAIQIDSYGLFDLARSIDSIRHNDHPTAAQLARADAMLTASFSALGEDYLTGQIRPKSVNQSWHINTQDEQVDSALFRSLRDKDLAAAMTRMRPNDPDYELLRQRLADYRKVAQTGWPSIPPGKARKRGDRDTPERLAALRSRLRVEGFSIDSASPDSPTVYDAALAAAVAQFQTRHAIVVDSQLGTETLDALNVPATVRLAQIAGNLERYRWMPRTLGDRYVFVNVPAFRLQAFEGGEKTLEMKVIVGKEFEGKATPVFSDSMELVTFRPYWDVPPSIAQNELIPKGIPADFVQSGTDGGQPHYRQRPGPNNALGFVKFLFPNDFNIYLHDTPNHALFDQDVRAFSHGCIRLEKPDEMAQWVLGWDLNQVHEAMQNGPDDHSVRLKKKIPVYIAYFTAYMRDGQLWFGNDLYHRDDELVREVAKGAMPTGEAVRAIDALRKLTD